MNHCRGTVFKALSPIAVKELFVFSMFFPVCVHMHVSISTAVLIICIKFGDYLF